MLETDDTNDDDDDDDVKRCKTCEEELEKHEEKEDVCVACQMYWLVGNNTFESRIAKLLENGSTPTQGESTQQPLQGQVYRDISREPLDERQSKRQRRENPERVTALRESNEYQYEKTRRMKLVQLQKEESEMPRRTKKRAGSTDRMTASQLKRNLDRELRRKRERPEESVSRNAKTTNDSQVLLTEEPRAIQQAQGEGDRSAVDDLERILSQRERLRGNMEKFFMGILSNAFPQVEVSQRIILPTREQDRCLHSFEETEKNAELLVVPFFKHSSHPSFVIRERLENGKFLFFPLDPSSTTDGERWMKQAFQQVAKELFQGESELSVWMPIAVPKAEDRDDRYDRIVLAFASLAMFLTLRQRNNTLFHNENVSFEFTAKREISELVKWARKWIHDSLQGDELRSDFQVDRAMEAYVISGNGDRKRIKSSAKSKKRKRSK